jgi:hypothetical protein
MAASFYSNLTADVEEHLTMFVDFAITGYFYWCTIGSEHGIARVVTLRALASVVDESLARVKPEMPRPFFFREWFTPRFPYISLYVFPCLHQFTRDKPLNGQQTSLQLNLWFWAYYVIESLDSDP